MKKIKYALTFLVLVILSTFFSATSVKADDFLKFHWKFDEGSGVTAADSSGNTPSYPGTLYNGPTWLMDGGISLDGINDYTRTNSPIPNSMGEPDQAYTLSASVRIAPGETNGNIIHISDGANGVGWCISMLHLYQGKFRAIGWQNDQRVTAVASTTATVGEWYSISNTWSPESGELRLYINGELAAATPMTSFDAADAPVYVFAGIDGSGCDSSQGWFKGDVKDVRIYSRAITEEEAEENSNASLGNISANFSPVDNATDVLIDQNLVLTFSTSTVATSTGVISIYHTDDDSLFEEFELDSAQISIDGDEVTINPSSDFDMGTEYYVHIPNTAFVDGVGNTYPGTIASTTWSFVTEEYVPIDPVLTESVAIPEFVTADEAKYYYTLSNPDELEGVFVFEEPITEDEDMTVAVNHEEGYVYFTGLDVGYTYETSFSMYVSDTDSYTNILTVGPFTVIEEEQEETSSRRKSGSSVKTRVHNLLAMGNTNLAQELMNQYPAVFSDQNTIAPDNASATTQTDLVVRDLELTLTGPDVKALQQLLNAQGYLLAETGVGSIGNETEYFGALTQNALARYQAANNILPSVGYFGPLTRAQMKSAGLSGLWW